MSRLSRRAVLAGGAALAARPAFGVALPPVTTSSRIEALLGRMTVTEKAGQLTLMASAIGGRAATALNPPGTGPSAEAQLSAAREGQLTGIFNGEGSAWHRRLQQAAVQSRLGIPLIFAADVIHGFRTIFPVPLGEAASFDPDLARRTARAAAVEASAAGIDWTFAPMVDIARDARWGRAVEGSGEDVLLGRLFAATRVAGFQGRDLAAPDALAACAKHFAAYGAAEAGLDYNSVDVSERTLRQVYFPPFEAAFGAGAPTVMAAFNELSGIPATANHWLLTDVLRGEWNFRGLVVSDYTADEELIAHGYARDGRDAARLAFLAGVDMCMQSGLYRDHLPALVEAGAVPMARLDKAVRRVLVLKAAVGLLDDPFRRLAPGREKRFVGLPAHRALAREAAQRSIVLLKNEGGLLPLRPGQRIALIGPFAAGPHDLIGPWNVYGDDREAIDLATGLGAGVTVAPGSGVETVLPGGIPAAVAAARAADVAVLAIGESQVMSGEAQSRTEITVPAPQLELVRAVAATGKPMVIVLSTGRALALDDTVLAARAIVVGWFLGSESGNAMADVLRGRVAPSGRLPVSFPIESGQVPYHYDHKPTGRPASNGAPVAYKARYRTVPNAARFAFGHGLTYGDITYGPIILDPVLAWDGKIEVSAVITNRGHRAATEVAQLYVRPHSASVTQPVRRLIAFQRLDVPAGGTATAAFTIRRQDLAFVGVDKRAVTEPGAYDIWVAPSAEAGAPATLLLGAPA
ncbi:glycoside hydrolase family 3 N-terminal domain-containing protein [Sandarakinorhabdus sp. DWP1-3-1]|uniref:glycoside hydrolase family 3 N-terminal domain-containing protein n=1 Tax=Sandarakinorhabdus sp. DWP1-3-1 TaxID=2804627 RepID=UPI003CE9FE0F